MTIRTITTANTKLADYPWDLLLLADPEQKIVRKYLKTNETAIYRGEENRVEGVIVWQQQTDHFVEIMNLAVTEASQGLGIATQLIKYMIASVTLAGQGQTLIVKTGDTSQAALATYQKNGFTIQEVVTDYFVTHYLDPIYENGEQLRNQVILTRNL